MSLMRTQGLRSSSQGEIGLFNYIQRIESPNQLLEKTRRTAAATTVKPRDDESRVRTAAEENTVKPREDPNSRVIFTVGWDSPERDESESKKKIPDEGFCGFFAACFLCKKKLKKDKDIYMYGYLGAFCSPECRDDRMALDEFDKQIDKESAEMAKVANRMINDSSRQGLGHKRFK